MSYKQIQRKGAKQEKEDMKYNIEMMKIESSAMRAFQSDVSQNPELAKELSKNNPLFKKMAKTEMSSSSKMNSRFGEESSTEESTVLVRGRERALDTIAKKFERKSRWLERKTAEGQTYYWNKETLGNYFLIKLLFFLTSYSRNKMDGTEEWIPFP